ncbi:hypothetical protein EIP86_007940 [Pleurotus ostreatoroseus]|nr:hypothetical protein EIP86_007940 [Pleurotus ostreatoroseus]
MSLNDRDETLRGTMGVDTYPGVANPTRSSAISDPLEANFATDPTIDEAGAGAGPNFQGHKDAERAFKQTAGVVEGRPGIIESTNIDPLNENSNEDDGWANARTGGSSGITGTAWDTASGVASSAATMAGGAARMAYGHIAGDEDAKQAGKEAIWGKQ